MSEDVVGNVIRVDFGERFGAVPLAIPLDTVENTASALVCIQTTVELALAVLSKCAVLDGCYTPVEALQAVRDLIEATSRLI